MTTDELRRILERGRMGISDIDELIHQAVRDQTAPSPAAGLDSPKVDDDGSTPSEGSNQENK